MHEYFIDKYLQCEVDNSPSYNIHFISPHCVFILFLFLLSYMYLSLKDHFNKPSIVSNVRFNPLKFIYLLLNVDYWLLLKKADRTKAFSHYCGLNWEFFSRNFLFTKGCLGAKLFYISVCLWLTHNLNQTLYLFYAHLLLLQF